jgi:hypothetical protein
MALSRMSALPRPELEERKMRKLFIATAALALITLAPCDSIAQSKASAAFDKLKSLAGTWETKTPEGVIPITYGVTANGSAVVETIGSGDWRMVSVYHMDHDRLLMTHYCGHGNQPRMAATPAPGEVKSLSFDFVDISNLASPDAGYMRSLKMSFVDADHIVNVWTDRIKGKDEVKTFDLQRKR